MGNKVTTNPYIAYIMVGDGHAFFIRKGDYAVVSVNGEDVEITECSSLDDAIDELTTQLADALNTLSEGSNEG